MVVMIHDSDIPDGWEREGEEHEYFLQFSPDSYSVGIDVLFTPLPTDRGRTGPPRGHRAGPRCSMLKGV